MELIYYPNPLLMQKTRPIQANEPDLEPNIRRMFELMYENNGIGLAAPQVGWNARLFILNINGTPEGEERVLINPRIISRSGTVNDAEGCLSFPGLFVKVKRSRDITVEYEDLEFRPHQTKCDGLLARAVQHEMDHLDNILLVHRMSHTEKIRNRNLLDDLKENYESSLEEDASTE